MTSQYRSLKHGSTHGYNASNAIQISQANNENLKNPFNYSMIINVSTLSFDEGAKSAWSAVHWSSCARLWGVLWFILHAARSVAAFLGNGFIPLILHDITDHTFLMVLISGLFASHKRTSVEKNFLAYPWCMRCYRFLHKSISVWQRMVINVWFYTRS